MQVAVTHAGGHHPQQHLVVQRLVDINLLDGKGLVSAVKNCSFHLILPAEVVGLRPAVGRRQPKTVALTIPLSPAQSPAEI
jgi:hypothetical protein